MTLLGYEIWQSRYGGAPIIGHRRPREWRSVHDRRNPATRVSVSVPDSAVATVVSGAWNRRCQSGPADARSVRPSYRGTDLPAARAEMQTIAATIAEANPESHKGLQLAVTTLSDSVIVTRRDGGIFSTLMGAVGIVLLIACANVASLLLARSTHRSREIAVRTSLGATRWRILRQLLVECGLIALMASALGAWLSIFGARQISRAFGVYEVGAPGGAMMPYWVDLSFNGPAWIFLGAVVLFTSLAAGVVPAWHLLNQRQ